MAGRESKRRNAGRAAVEVPSGARAIQSTPTMLDVPDASTVPPRVEDRVEHIAQLMASALWRTGVTNRHLATTWGLSLETIGNYAAEASRIVRRDIGSAEDIRTRALLTLERHAAACAELREAHPGYAKALTDSIALMTGLGGCPPVTRTEVTGADGRPMVSPEDVRRMAAEIVDQD